MDFPLDNIAAPPHLTTYSRWSALREVQVHTGATIAVPSSTSWGTANTAKFYPITIPFAYNVRRVFWVNGSSTTGNRDFGIYTKDGIRIYSTGSTAPTPASGMQYVTPSSPIKLLPGDYYFAWVGSVTTNGCWGSAPAAEQIRFAGIFEQASALPLPATATFASATNAVVNMCGVTWTSSGF